METELKNEELIEIKILVLGDKSTGKTSIIQRYLNNTFQENQKETLCIDNFSQNIKINEKEIKVTILDSSGSQYTKNITNYIKDSVDFIVLTYTQDSKSSITYVNEWMPELKNFNKPIIIMKNKIDLLNEELNKNKDILTKNIIYEFYECSAKTGENITNCFNKIIKKICEEKEDLIYIQKFIGDGILCDDNTTEFEIIEKEEEKEEFHKEQSQNQKQTKNISKLDENEIKNLKKFYNQNPVFIRCDDCKKLPIIKFNSTCNSAEIKCNECGKMRNETYKSIENNSKELLCITCAKNIDQKEFSDIVYSYKYKQFVCKKCYNQLFKTASSKTLEANESTIPFSLMDVTCSLHKKFKNYICTECNHGLCEDCLEIHKNKKNHKPNIINDKILTKLIQEKKEFIKKEEELFEQLDEYFTDLIDSLNKKYQHFKRNKMREINFKKNLLSILSKIKYNYELFYTCQNLTFENLEKPLSYDKNRPWEEKLKNFFNYIKEPIEIVNYSIEKKNIKMYVGDLTNGWKDNEVRFKNSRKNTYDLTNDLKLNIEQTNNSENKSNLLDNNFSTKNNPIIYDATKLDNEHFCVTNSQGYLKVFNKKIELVSNNKILDDYKGGFKILKINDNTLFISSFEKISIVDFSYDYKECKITDEIKEDKNLFTSVCPFGENLIYSTLNGLFIYNRNTKEKINIFKNLFLFDDNILLLSIDNIRGTNTYIIKYQEKDNLDKSSFNDFMNNNNLPKYNDLIKIITLNDENKIETDYELEENFEILGPLNRNSILLNKHNTNKINDLYIYSIKDNKNNLVVKDLQKYIGFSLVKSNKDFTYFLLINTNFCINYYSYDTNLTKVENISFISNKSNIKYNLPILSQVKSIQIGSYLILIFKDGLTIKIKIF